MLTYEGNEKYIFISYAHKDSERVLSMISQLQAMGYRIWFDSGIEAGSEWPEYIAEHLYRCEAVLVFMSSAAAASRNCRDEINFALENNKAILVAYLEETEMTLGMRLRLSATQAIFRDRHSSDRTFIEELCRSKLLLPCKGEPQQAVSVNTELSKMGQQYYSDGDYASALDCYRKAMEAGDPDGQFGYGRCLYYGKGIPQDTEAAYALFVEAAQRNSAAAENALGICYEDGRVVSKNMEIAVSWYQKAMEHGNKTALANLARCYKNGTGVPKDIHRAVALYRQAADHDIGLGYAGLAKCYAAGEGVERNPKEAFRYLRKAAEKGNTWAQYELGCYYMDGIGTEVNFDESKKWLQKAAANGSSSTASSARVALARLNERTTKQTPSFVVVDNVTGRPIDQSIYTIPDAQGVLNKKTVKKTCRVCGYVTEVQDGASGVLRCPVCRVTM